MTGVSESYFAAYAVFLKATTQQIALLASLPPLLASFSQLLSVWFAHKTGLRNKIIVAGAVIQVLALVAIALIPNQTGDLRVQVLVVCVIAYFVGPNIGAPIWGSLMGTIVPVAARGRFFALRTRLSSIASFCALVVGGIILQVFDVLDQTSKGFLAIFAIGVLCRSVSTYHLSKIHDPPQTINLEESSEESLFQTLKTNRKFVRFSLFFSCMQFAVAISGPFVVVYLLRDLHYSYLQLTCNTAASVLVQFLVLNRWGRLGDLFGNRIVIRVTGSCIPFIPALWVLSSDFAYLILVQAISGLIWSGFTLSAANSVYDLTPPKKRASLMALHPKEIVFSTVNIQWMSVFYGVFLASSLTRLMVALMFLPRIKEVRAVKQMSYSGLIFRMTRFSPISGLIFEVVSRRLKDGRNGKKDIDKYDNLG
jgi:Na+/melibiose symporter-like transporter